jgi:hypothetical protein
VADAPLGWHPEARYEFQIHTAGGEHEDLTYRVTFGPDAGGGTGQTVALHVLTGPEARDDTAEGELLAEGRTGTVITGPAGLRLWTGRAHNWCNPAKVSTISDWTPAARTTRPGARPTTYSSNAVLPTPGSPWITSARLSPDRTAWSSRSSTSRSLPRSSNT